MEEKCFQAFAEKPLLRDYLEFLQSLANKTGESVFEINAPEIQSKPTKRDMGATVLSWPFGRLSRLNLKKDGRAAPKAKKRMSFKGKDLRLMAAPVSGALFWTRTSSGAKKIGRRKLGFLIGVAVWTQACL